MMRLRSSQFVMLLLLACSVQVGETYALRMMTGQALHAVSLPEGRIAAARGAREMSASVARLYRMELSPSQCAAAAERTAWAMCYPAAAAAALAGYTGLLRA